MIMLVLHENSVSDIYGRSKCVADKVFYDFLTMFIEDGFDQIHCLCNRV